jgi:hypothetical protein
MRSHVMSAVTVDVHVIPQRFVHLIPQDSVKFLLDGASFRPSV